MFKKLGWLALGVVGLMFLLSSTKFGSYASTAWNRMRANANKQVPIEFEIERIKDQVARLVPDMKKNLGAIAEEMVAVENLREEIARTREKLADQKQNILTMTADLESGSEYLVYGGRSYSRDRLQSKLAADLASYKRCEEELASRVELLEAKERSLDATREQLATMRDQKRELEVQIAQLEAELKTVRLAQSRCEFQLDDSRLAEIKASLADVRNRLKVEAKTAELQGEFANDAIPVERKQRSADEVIREVREYFNNNGGKVAVEQ